MRMNYKDMKNLTKKLIVAIFSLALFITNVYAHVAVKPSTVGIASLQTFTIGVPNEKEIPTIAVKILIPNGLGEVSPTVKPGWKIEVKKDSDKSDAKVTEISWTEGNIPPEQRNDFSFSAQAPANETTLTWKAYQIYQDGTVVAWDQDPGKMQENKDEGGTPYSQTKVVNDLTTTSTKTTDQMPLYLSIAALVVAVLALALAGRKKI